jgi:hypothetical protein
MADLAAARRLLLARLACVRRYADWPRTFWRAPYALLLGSPCPPTPWRQLTHSVACLLAVCVSGGSNPAGGPGAPRRRSGHDVAAELVRSHQAPGTVSRSVLTALDRVHGVGIVVSGTGLCFHPVCVRGVGFRGIVDSCTDRVKWLCWFALVLGDYAPTLHFLSANHTKSSP